MKTVFSQNQQFLSDLYDELDEKVGYLKARAGIDCPAGCGRCCEGNQAETTVLEWQLLAMDLWRKNKAEFWLEKARLAPQNSRCIFYNPDRVVPGNGRCEVYSFRPLICRLFGFTARTNKNGETELVTCATIKEKYAQQYEKVKELVSKGFLVPKMPDFSFQVLNLDTRGGQKLLPINEAARIALESTGLVFQKRQSLGEFGEDKRKK